MSDSAGSRPRQLSMATWFVIVGSVFLVLSVFDRITTLNSVDSRADIARALSSDSAKGLGLTVDQAVTWMRVGLTVSAVCAAAALVLGVFALQRHRGARLGLTVLAVPILLTAPLTGGLVGALIVAATAMMWTGQARDWFAGRPVRALPTRSSEESPPPPPTSPPPPPPPAAGPPAQEPETPDRAEPKPPPSAPDLSTEHASSRPGPVSGYGSVPVSAPVLDQPAPPAGGPAVAPYTLPRRGLPVPSAVRIACFITWVFAGVVALLYVAMLVVLLAARDLLVDEVVAMPAWKEAGLEREVLVPVMVVGSLMFLGWSVASMVLAWFAWRRHNWARYLLVGSAAASILAAFFAFPFGIPHQLAGGLAIWGLLTAPARDWYDAPRPDSRRLPPGQWGSPPPGQWGSPPPGQWGSPPPPQPDPDQEEPPKPPVW